MVSNLPAMRRPGSDPWVGKVSWRREWQPTPVFLPGEFHGQRSLVGYSPWGHTELDMTEQIKITEGTSKVAKLINYLKYLKARGLKKKKNVRIRSIG